MGAHEDIPFTGWGCDRPEDYAPPQGHVRPAVRPVEGIAVQVTSPHLDDYPHGCPCVSCRAAAVR
jgi:hypothetical protein